MDERCGLIEPMGSLRQCGFIGPHEQKTGRHGYLCVAATMLADEDQSCSAISHSQNDGLALPRLDRLHSDEKFTDRLVKILKPKLRSDLCCRKSKTQLLRARIDVRQRRGIGLKAEFGRRHGNKLYICFPGAKGK